MEIREGTSLHTVFLKRHGEGIHHVAKYVENADNELAEFHEHGVKMFHRGSGTHRLDQ
ncbi:VOC family protein [Candidatus Poribacteria bacterium]|nr:VOC family protein [Candidatus Poribacteria bacterium]